MSQTEPQQSAVERTGEGLYPIRTVSALTGVNPVTLRAWERRYGLIRPQRTPKGHRLYAEADIERIQHILQLLDQGIPIGQTRRLLDSDEAPVPMQAETGAAGPWEDYRERMRRSIARFDAAALEGTYNEALSLYPVNLVTRELLQPLLAELGLHRDGREAVTVAEERFFRAFIRNKLGARLHHQAGQARGARVIVAGLPGECAETSLMLFALSALASGYRVVLLGADTPVAPLVEVVRRTDARAVLLVGEHAPADDVVQAVAALAETLPCPVAVGGDAAERVSDALSDGGAHPLGNRPEEGLAHLRELMHP
ncbi:hypothetical protein KBTX_02855 [wastewater metagenome]|uniref:HTH merR-type domain-containing protein n=2 Tax=unclassified sequences TaxID=12908 RepID=A0A5B8RHU6_9ZZZZ|nr:MULTISPECIES: MerR family transcriptional regulator [Arhodomonas]MCS4502887.1 MerR family transcriptional regulator [Arhodomonas aquaeolei]QEA06515.1 hypothetical protein KBTEX_02855 [uncultured organism]